MLGCYKVTWNESIGSRTVQGGIAPSPCSYLMLAVQHGGRPLWQLALARPDLLTDDERAVKRRLPPTHKKPIQRWAFSSGAPGQKNLEPPRGRRGPTIRRITTCFGEPHSSLLRRW